MANDERGQETRLLARFMLYGSADGYRGYMPMASGDYVAETRRVGDDLEVLLFERNDRRGE
jgi:hypothetical protein